MPEVAHVLAVVVVEIGLEVERRSHPAVAETVLVEERRNRPVVERKRHVAAVGSRRAAEAGLEAGHILLAAEESRGELAFVDMAADLEMGLVLDCIDLEGRSPVVVSLESGVSIVAGLIR